MAGSAFHLPLAGEPHPEIGAALDIALGASLGGPVETWPVGLAQAWNDAADQGAFAPSQTIGDMARAFLEHRLARFTVAS